MDLRETLDALRELRERVDEDITEVPAKWIEEYDAVLDAADEWIRCRFALRVSRSEIRLSRDPFDERGRPVVGERMICASDIFARKVDAGIAFVASALPFWRRADQLPWLRWLTTFSRN